MLFNLMFNGNSAVAGRAPLTGREFEELLTRPQVNRIIARETARAERNGNPFSIVLFRVRRGRPGLTRRGSTIERQLARTLMKRIRLTDIAGWFNDQHLCVVLPDTASHGARIFAESICNELAVEARRPKCVIYSYPFDCDAGDENSPLKPIRNGRKPGGEDPGDNPFELTRVTGPGRHANRFKIASEFDDGGGVALMEAPAAESSTAAPLRLTDEAEVEQPEVRPLQTLLARPMPRWKRALDIVGASFGLMCLAPLFAVVAMAIKFTSSGPVIFHQKRSGVGGKVFTICKFRTMCNDAEAKKKALRKFSEQDGPAFKLKNDPRITSIGHILRKTSIDELPQLWNVLKGDMSLVGPRPLPVDEAGGCERWQQRRHDVTPGLTCIWQIEGRSQVSFADWVRMDVKYMRRRTIVHDLLILFKTVPAVLLRRGAR